MSRPVARDSVRAMAGFAAIRVLALTVILAAGIVAAGCGTTSKYSCGAECEVSINGTADVELDSIGATVSVPETGDGTATINVSGSGGEGSIDLAVGEQGTVAGYDVLLGSVDGSDVDFRIRPAQ